MAPLFGTHTKNTTVTKWRGCSVELQGSSKVGIRDTIVFLICLMCWGRRLFLKGDRGLDLFCFTKLLTVWHKCPLKASLSRRIRVLEENTATPACTWWNCPEEDLSSGKLESSHPSRTFVKSIEVFYGVESVVRGNADSLLN